MARKAFLVVVLLLATAAIVEASQDAPNVSGFTQPGTPPITVPVVDMTTTGIWTQAIHDAAGEWSKAAGLELAITHGAPSCAPIPYEIVICEEYNDAGGYGRMDWWASGADIWMGVIYLNTYDPPSILTVRQGTACHELGHALGLEHPDAPVTGYTGCMSGSGNGYVPNAAEMAAIDQLYPCGCVVSTPTVLSATNTPTPTATRTPTATPCPKKGKCR